MLMLKDTVIQDIFQFLDSCECEPTQVAGVGTTFTPLSVRCTMLITVTVCSSLSFPSFLILVPSFLPRPFSPRPLSTDPVHGRNIPSVIEEGPLVEHASASAGKSTVAYQARLLKALFIRVT